MNSGWRLFSENLFSKRQFRKASEGTALNFHGTRNRVTPDIWPTQLKILRKNCHYLIDATLRPFKQVSSSFEGASY